MSLFSRKMKESRLRHKEVGFRKPSPEIEAVYEKMLMLGLEGVWVPAVDNGGLRQLLAELEVRGWKILPPSEKKMSPESFLRVLDESRVPYRKIPVKSGRAVVEIAVEGVSQNPQNLYAEDFKEGEEERLRKTAVEALRFSILGRD